MTNRIISYWASGLRNEATQDWKQCQDNLHREAVTKGNIDESDPWDLSRIQDTAFYRDNLEILSQPRGAGYWLWKPYIILQTMKSMKTGDFVFYHDVGKPELDKNKANRIFRDISPAQEFAHHNGGIFPGPYIPYAGPNKVWVKRDCFMLMDCDSVKYWKHCQIQATYNVWEVCQQSIDFVEEWLAYCSDPRILTDQPNEMGEENWPAFLDHRHDQAVLTLLCIKKGVKSFGSPTENIYRHRNINFFIKAYLDSQNENQKDKE